MNRRREWGTRRHPADHPARARARPNFQIHSCSSKHPGVPGNRYPYFLCDLDDSTPPTTPSFRDLAGEDLWRPRRDLRRERRLEASISHHRRRQTFRPLADQRVRRTRKSIVSRRIPRFVDPPVVVDPRRRRREKHPTSPARRWLDARRGDEHASEYGRQRPLFQDL